MSSLTVLLCLFTILCTSLIIEGSESELPLDFKPNSENPLTNEELLTLRDEAKEMFYHGYNAYMDNAFPADELMPLSCKGRWRDSEVSRGDVDEALGNFSLTLVDALDTLVIMGDLQEFEKAVELIIKEVSFDNNVVVSVFETNIRMVGGLISGHILAEHVNQLYGVLDWYRGELLGMAQDLATRLLPAFNTTTGIPHPRVNLKYGLKSPKVQNSRDTCTACAGTIILEFASLSRLTGNPIFEEKARQVMDYLWAQRHRGSDLVGTVLNVHSGDWVRRDSGVGAGIDSYYEYLLKAYILLGDDSYLDRFNKHYTAVMKYISQGPMLLDVHMHRPHTTSRNFMDALLAFWPGLQVLKGDIKPAIETHEMLYQVIQRHNFLPEAFTTDFQVHWGQHPLRPEFVESTYLLYQATGDPYYLRVGEKVLKSLQKHAFVPCGYAAVKDVRTGAHEDRMDSFVLAETFKYLYLLFTDPKDLLINLDEFIFTTEAHLLPLTLARLSNLTTIPLPESQSDPIEPDVEYARSCPNAHYMFPGRHQFAEAIRKPLKNFVSNICPPLKVMLRKLRANEFNSQNMDHIDLLRDMGINIMLMKDGRVQLLHTASNAKTTEDAEEGVVFLQEMLELSRMQQDQPDNPPRSVSFKKTNDGGIEESTFIIAGPAQFGLELNGDVKVTGPILIADPIKACTKLENAEDMRGHIVFMERGDCMFIDKARLLQAAGAIGGIVIDNSAGSSADSAPMFAMSGDGNNDVNIPLVFLFRADAEPLLEIADRHEHFEVTLSDYPKPDKKEDLRNKEFIIHHTGSAVKSSIKKHQDNSEVVCNDDIVTAEVTSTNDDKLATQFREPIQAIKIADTPEAVLKACVGLIEKSQAEDVTSKSIVNLLESVLLLKFNEQPKIIKEFISIHLEKFIESLQMLSLKEYELASIIRKLADVAFSHKIRDMKGSLQDILLEDHLKEILHRNMKKYLPSIQAALKSGGKGFTLPGNELVGTKVEFHTDKPVSYSEKKGDPGHDEL